ncbi:MAG: hypothetical protein GQ570_10605 [Helicobacteraceae bacterium]|nr:hypothetical protein [Helicobacteraceae bacterium]
MNFLGVYKKIIIILLLLTLFTYTLGYLGVVNSLFVGVILVTTFIKAQLVIEYFMGLKDVSLKYRIIPSLWLFIVISLIAFAYYLPINKA